MSRSPQQLVTRNFLALGAGEMAARVIAFGASIVLARRLGAAGFGVVAFATALVLYLARVADAGVDFALGIRTIAAARDRLPVLVPAVLTLRLSLALALIAVCSVAALLLLPEPDGMVVALYSFTLIGVAASTRWVHVGMERTRLVGLARATGEAAMLVLIGLTVHRAADLYRAPLAQLAGDLLAAGILAVALRRSGLDLRLRWDGAVARTILRQAVPYVGSTLLGLFIYNADLILLRLFGDVQVVGYYAAAYAPVSFLINIGVAYALSLLPTLTRLGSDPVGQRELYHTSAAHILALAIPVAVGGSLVATQLVALVYGDAFAPAASAMAILLWSVPFSAVRDAPVMVLMAHGRERILFRVTALSAGASLLLNLVLIPRFGMTGAAIATVLTEAFRMSVAFLEARRLGLPIPWVARLWKPAAAAAAMAAILLVMPTYPLALRIAAGLAAYGTALTLLGGVRWRAGRLPSLDV